MAQDVLGARVEVELDNGTVVEVAALGPLFFRDIVKQAEKVHPDPDPKPFEKPVEDGFTENTVIPGEESPEWQRLRNIALINRGQIIQDLILKFAVFSPDREAIIEAHRGLLDSLEGIDLTTNGDEWHTVLRYFLTTEADLNRITAAAQRKSFLTEGEVQNGLKYFRLDIRRNTHS